MRSTHRYSSGTSNAPKWDPVDLFTRLDDGGSLLPKTTELCAVQKQNPPVHILTRGTEALISSGRYIQYRMCGGWRSELSWINWEGMLREMLSSEVNWKKLGRGRRGRSAGPRSPTTRRWLWCVRGRMRAAWATLRCYWQL